MRLREFSSIIGIGSKILIKHVQILEINELALHKTDLDCRQRGYTWIAKMKFAFRRKSQSQSVPNTTMPQSRWRTQIKKPTEVRVSQEAWDRAEKILEGSPELSRNLGVQPTSGNMRNNNGDTKKTPIAT